MFPYGNKNFLNNKKCIRKTCNNQAPPYDDKCKLCREEIDSFRNNTIITCIKCNESKNAHHYRPAGKDKFSKICNGCSNFECIQRGYKSRLLDVKENI